MTPRILKRPWHAAHGRRGSQSRELAAHLPSMEHGFPQDDPPAGRCHFGRPTVNLSRWVDQPVRRTDVLGVRRSWRRRGVASALLAATMAALRTDGIERMDLDVNTDNSIRALDLYRPRPARTTAHARLRRGPCRRCRPTATQSATRGARNGIRWRKPSSALAVSPRRRRGT